MENITELVYKVRELGGINVGDVFLMSDGDKVFITNVDARDGFVTYALTESLPRLEYGARDWQLARDIVEKVQH